MNPEGEDRIFSSINKTILKMSWLIFYHRSKRLHNIDWAITKDYDKSILLFDDWGDIRKVEGKFDDWGDIVVDGVPIFM